ncbi:MAG: aldehyde dehydrogenase [Oscillospiraceae bacterium]|nr:aldehyde dehydrogenase [Oscillospiraceae bacterium]
MTETAIQQIVQKQRAYFQTGATLGLDFRLQALERLSACIRVNEQAIHKALWQDLGKSPFEGYMCETGMVLSELSYMRRHLRAFAKERAVRTPLAQFHARSYKKPSPYGVTLIMSPWNYPFLLTMEPLVDAIAAGNTAVVKPSAYSPHTSQLMARMIRKCFSQEYVAVVTGGRAENAALLEQKFDLIFFTGSQAVGREVMARASEHLTPVILELGGKSPCVVDRTANLKLAARRIVFGKYLNCGQTCVAPDYVYCDRRVKDELVTLLRKEIAAQFWEYPLENPDYGRIVNEKHFTRILNLMDPAKVVHGGASNRETLQIEPTVMDGVTFQDPVMGEEIFGPLLPILTYDSPEEAIVEINRRPHPLALYVFTGSKAIAQAFTTRCGFGGGCVNDVIIHLATSEMGFGGFGESGMGSYHGREGFNAFSHSKSIVDKSTWMDLPMRYQPYRGLHEKLIRMFMR